MSSVSPSYRPDLKWISIQAVHPDINTSRDPILFYLFVFYFLIIFFFFILGMVNNKDEGWVL